VPRSLGRAGRFRLGWYEQLPSSGLIDWSSKVDCGTVNTTSTGVAAVTIPGGTQVGGRWVYAACLRETKVANPTLQVNTMDPDLKGLRFAINNEPVAGMWTPSVATGSLPTSQPAVWDMFWCVVSVFARVA